MENYLTAEEFEVELGEQLRAARLRRNLTQEELATRAGVSRTAVRALERGSGSTVQTLVRVLKALGMQDWLKSLQPEVTVSPLQMLRSSKPRQRARSPRRTASAAKA
ncbi:hypothetical protein GCM10027399_11880 [Curvibacter fontanus]|jgi:transcriptional regulator with XRE-family HTH domain